MRSTSLAFRIVTAFAFVAAATGGFVVDGWRGVFLFPLAIVILAAGLAFTWFVAGVVLTWRRLDSNAANTRKRMYLGEFGAIDHADPKSRENYIKLVRQEAERHGFGWAYWDDGGKNKAMIVDSGEWVPVIKASLFD